MTVQQMADVATNVESRVADEMLRACAVWSYEHGIPVSIPRERLFEVIAKRCDAEWHEPIPIYEMDPAWLRYVERTAQEAALYA